MENKEEDMQIPEEPKIVEPQDSPSKHLKSVLGDLEDNEPAPITQPIPEAEPEKPEFCFKEMMGKKMKA